MRNTIKIKMYPTREQSERGRSGIDTVCRAYYRLFPKFNIEVVEGDEHLTLVHAGVFPADVAMLHGFYFTDQYLAAKWEWRANADIIASMRYAYALTVPSPWVAETVQRDFRVDPYVIDHGVFYDEWQHDEEVQPIVLWAKNRNADICDPSALNILAKEFPSVNFVTTFKPEEAQKNIIEIGVQSHEKIKKIIQRSAVVLSTVKETWGIMYVEAMAAGTPVLSVNSGHVPNLIKHGQTGYVYEEGNTNDMAAGLEYCLTNRKVLSDNGKFVARSYTWDSAVSKLRNVFEIAMERKYG